MGWFQDWLDRFLAHQLLFDALWVRLSSCDVSAMQLHAILCWAIHCSPMHTFASIMQFFYVVLHCELLLALTQAVSGLVLLLSLLEAHLGKSTMLCDWSMG